MDELGEWHSVETYVQYDPLNKKILVFASFSAYGRRILFLSKLKGMRKDYTFSVDIFETADELNRDDADLLTKARQITGNAYAPYSQFHVGAVARMTNGQLMSGTNQENASYPIGLCAERVLLSAASSVFPNIPIVTIAISYNNINGASDHPIAPCGICRQSLQEYEERTDQPIRLILGGKKGKIYVIESASQLLPLAFTKKELDRL
jgi:cytidine deaminase